MRIEVAGAQITDSVVEVLETLQNDLEVIKAYLEAIDEVIHTAILDISGYDEAADSKIMSRLRALQMIHRDLTTLAAPPDVDLPENDTPAAQL